MLGAVRGGGISGKPPPPPTDHGQGTGRSHLAQHRSSTENCFSYTTRFRVYFPLLKWMNRRHASGSNLNAFSALRAERAPRETQRVRLCGGLMLAGGPRRAPVDRCRFGGLFARQRLPQVADQRRAAAGVHRSGRSERCPHSGKQVTKAFPSS